MWETGLAKVGLPVTWSLSFSDAELSRLRRTSCVSAGDIFLPTQWHAGSAIEIPNEIQTICQSSCGLRAVMLLLTQT